MAAPTFKAYSDTAEGGGSGSSSVSVNYVTPIAANDLLILFVFNNGIGTIVTPTGWTSIGSKQSFDGTSNMSAFKRKASGSETGTVTVNRIKEPGSGVMGRQMFSFDGTDFIDVLAFATDSDSTSTIDISSITISGTERTLLAFILNTTNDPGAVTGTYTEQSIDSFDTGGFYFQASTKVNVTSAPAQTATNGLTLWITYHIAIYNNDPVITPTRSFIIN